MLEGSRRAFAAPVFANARAVLEPELHIDGKLQLTMAGDDRPTEPSRGGGRVARLDGDALFTLFEQPGGFGFGNALQAASDVVDRTPCEDCLLEVLGGAFAENLANGRDQVRRAGML